MTQDAAFLVALVCYLALALCLVAAYHRRRAQWSGIHQRPEQERIMRNALQEWLVVDRIVQTMVDMRVATLNEIATTYSLLPAMDSQHLRSTASALLRDRNVRRVIASWFVATYKGDRTEVLSALAEWAGPSPQRLGAVLATAAAQQRSA